MPKYIGNWPVPIEEILGQGGKDEASSLAYVNAPDFDSDCRVTVRLVDKKTKRERTVVATSTEPEWVRVAVGSGRIASSSGGSHTIDGHHHKGSRNGQGLLLEDIIEYAQSLESDARPTGPNGRQKGK